MKCQKSETNSCFFSSIVSKVFIANQSKAKKEITSCIQESLVSESKVYHDIMIFSNKNMEDREWKKGDQRLCYGFKHWKGSRLLGIINDISEYFTLV